MFTLFLDATNYHEFRYVDFEVVKIIINEKEYKINRQINAFYGIAAKKHRPIVTFAVDYFASLDKQTISKADIQAG